MSLQLRGIAKAFSDLKILDALDLDLESREIVAIVGESGSGKSTLLSLLGGFEKPDRGEVIWNGQATSSWKEAEWAGFRKRHLGFVFQSYHLLPYLNARENVALPLRLLGERESSERAESLLARLGLAARATHFPSELSGGERQRVAIARALVHQPELVLADEPTGSLDVKTGEQVLEVLFSLLRERGQTALVVTHSLEVARRCDRVLTLRQGRLWSSSI